MSFDFFFIKSNQGDFVISSGINTNKTRSRSKADNINSAANRDRMFKYFEDIYKYHRDYLIKWENAAFGMLVRCGNLLGYFPPDELVAIVVSKVLLGERHFDIDKDNIHCYMRLAMSSVLFNELRRRRREELWTVIVLDGYELCKYNPLEDFPDKDLEQIYYEQDMLEQIALFKKSLYGDDVWLLEKILEGYSNEQLSKEMRLCVPLVKNYRRQLIDKLRKHFNSKNRRAE